MRTIALASLALLITQFVHAAENFESAKITFIQKEVAVADLKVLELDKGGEIKRRDAALNESITKDNAVVTGQKSRAELEFNDGTITRLGQLSSFSFTQGTRNTQVKQGTALFVVPKGHGGTNIQAGPVTAAITGTTVLVQIVDGIVRIFVYEGSVFVEGKTITGGQVISVENGSSEVRRFDVGKAMATAALFTRFIDSPSSQAVDRQIAEYLKTIGSIGGTDHNGDLIDRAVLKNNVETQPFSGNSGGQYNGGFSGESGFNPNGGFKEGSSFE